MIITPSYDLSSQLRTKNFKKVQVIYIKAYIYQKNLNFLQKIFLIFFFTFFYQVFNSLVINETINIFIPCQINMGSQTSFIRPPLK